MVDDDDGVVALGWMTGNRTVVVAVEGFWCGSGAKNKLAVLFRRRGWVLRGKL